jgi:hypothetical protein
MAAPLPPNHDAAAVVPNTIAEMIAQVKECLKVCSIKQLEDLLVSMGKQPSEPSLAGSKGISYYLTSRHAALSSMIFPVRRRVDDSDMALALTVTELCKALPKLTNKERLEANRAYGVELEAGEVGRAQKSRNKQFVSLCSSAIQHTSSAQLILETEVEKLRRRKSMLRRAMNILDGDENYEVPVHQSLLSATSYVSHDYKPHLSNLQAACVRFSVAPAIPQLDAFVASNQQRPVKDRNNRADDVEGEEEDVPPRKKKFVATDHDDDSKKQNAN